MNIEIVDKAQAEVDIINSIQKLYKQQRQNSKSPTFALTYFCEPITLQNNQGFSIEKATRIYDAFRELYVDYFKYIDERLSHGSKYGYILLANGVRLDTPALFKGLLGTNTHTVDAEYRSAGNAISQSYGSLNTRGARRFMERVWDSKYRYTVFVFNLIHDAIYILAPKDAETISWVNKNLIECMCDIQDYPELHHPIVHLEAEMEIRLESWAKGVEVHNNISLADIKTIIGDK